MTDNITRDKIMDTYDKYLDMKSEFALVMSFIIKARIKLNEEDYKKSMDFLVEAESKFVDMTETVKVMGKQYMELIDYKWFN